MEPNFEELKESISTYVQEEISLYFRNKTTKFLQHVSQKFDINYSELHTLFIDFHDDLTNTINKKCQAITKTGMHCTHKCLPDKRFCKKHLKLNLETTENPQHIESYFP